MRNKLIILEAGEPPEVFTFTNYDGRELFKEGFQRAIGDDGGSCRIVALRLEDAFGDVMRWRPELQAAGIDVAKALAVIDAESQEEAP